LRVEIFSYLNGVCHVSNAYVTIIAS
jgi:hypothetical protein